MRCTIGLSAPTSAASRNRVRCSSARRCLRDNGVDRCPQLGVHGGAIGARGDLGQNSSTPSPGRPSAVPHGSSSPERSRTGAAGASRGRSSSAAEMRASVVRAPGTSIALEPHSQRAARDRQPVLDVRHGWRGRRSCRSAPRARAVGVVPAQPCRQRAVGAAELLVHHRLDDHVAGEGDVDTRRGSGTRAGRRRRRPSCPTRRGRAGRPSSTSPSQNPCVPSPSAGTTSTSPDRSSERPPPAPLRRPTTHGRPW